MTAHRPHDPADWLGTPDPIDRLADTLRLTLGRDWRIGVHRDGVLRGFGPGRQQFAIAPPSAVTRGRWGWDVLTGGEDGCMRWERDADTAAACMLSVLAANDVIAKALALRVTP